MKNKMAKVKAWLLVATMIVSTMVPQNYAHAMNGEESHILSEQNTVAADGVLVDTDDLYIRQEGNVAYVMEVNDLYSDVLSVDDLPQVDPEREIVAEDGTVSFAPAKFNATTIDGITYYDTVEEAAVALRQAMVKRQTTAVKIGFYTNQSDYKQAFKELKELAMEHTKVPTEGDAILFQYAGCGYGAYTYNDKIGYTISINYYTSNDQEKTLTAKVNQILGNLSLDGKNDYQKAQIIYDYITANVVYDYDNLEDDNYTLKYTAYAAAINGTAVCQGYANLFYRLALEAGVDSRIVSSGSMCHAWNIAQMGAYYYQLDSTWDAGQTKYDYFLKGSFNDHDLPDEYSNATFAKKYPLGTGTYSNTEGTSIAGYTLTLDTTSYTYDGSEKKPAVTLKNGQTVIGADNYTVTYSNNINAGTATVKVTGKGAYTGTVTKTFTILAAFITDATIDCNCDVYPYTGNPITPEVNISYNGKKLVKDIDYTVSYANNVNIGKASITINGKGNYRGSVMESFTISKDSSSETIDNLNYTFSVIDGTKVSSMAENGKPKLLIFYLNTCMNCETMMGRLLKDKDFSELDVVAVNWYGIEEAREEAESLGNNGMIFAYDDCNAAWTYSKVLNLINERGTATTPVVVYINDKNQIVYSTSGMDYDIVEHIEGYLGVSLTKVELKQISACSITLSNLTYVYDKTEKKPVVTVKDGNTVLEQGKDYTVTYADNVNVGTASVIIVGKGKYTGTVTKNFTITKAETTGDEPALVDGYYMIANASNLKWFASKVNSGKTNMNAKLTDDIVVNGAWTPIGTCTSHTEGNHFEGIFDGCGHTVSGLQVSNQFYAGLFGGLKNSAVIKNVGVVNSTIAGTKGVGAIAGGTTTAANSVVISGCFSEGNTITASYNGGSNAGGMIGGIWNSTGYIENSYTGNQTTVKATGSDSDFAGGLVGYFRGKKVENSFSLATLSGTTTGALAGYTTGQMTNCYSGSDARFASGEIAYLLNGKSAGTTWYQKLGTAAYPVLTTKGGDVVYGIEGYNHGESTKIVYVSNSAITGVKLHSKPNSEQNHDNSLDSGKVIKAPTTKETGLKLYSCTQCSYTKTEVIDKILEEIDFSNCIVTLTSTEYSYTGYTIVPKVKVTYQGATLSENIDYKVESDNVNATTAATCTVTGLGKYKGSVTKSFTILPKNISEVTVTLDKSYYEYTGSPINPVVTVKDGKTTLVSGTDYAVYYSNNIDVTDSAKVKVTGKGNYTGSVTREFSIAGSEKIDISTLDYGFEIEGDDEYVYETIDCIYTGNSIEPSIYIVETYSEYDWYVLEKDVDYKVTYLNNVNPGTATAIVKGIGDYGGEIVMYFTIIQMTDMKDVTVSIEKDVYTYTGSTIRPSVQVYDGATLLTKGLDYRVSYTDNTNVGIASVVITGLDRYTGTKTVNFKINPADISDLDIRLAEDTYDYTGLEIKPKVTVYNGATKLSSTMDYRVTYGDNINPGIGTVTVAGRGNYTGTAKLSFTINAVEIHGIDISDEDSFYIDFVEEDTFEYAGTAVKPEVFVYDFEEDDFLSENIDYKVTYKNNKIPGTATVVVEGIGDYEGLVSLKFKIVKGKSKISLSSKTASYTGKSISIGTAKVTGSKGTVTYTYYLDKACTKKTGTSLSAGGASASGKAPKVAGKYYVKAKVAEDSYYKSATSTVVSLTIEKIKQSITVTPDVKTVTYKRTTTYNLKAMVNEKPKVTYKKTKGSSYVKVASDGKVTVDKKLKRGTYKIYVDVTAAETRNYKKTTKNVMIKVIVK